MYCMGSYKFHTVKYRDMRHTSLCVISTLIAFNFPMLLFSPLFVKRNCGSLLENKNAGCSGGTLIPFTKALALGSIEWVGKGRFSTRGGFHCLPSPLRSSRRYIYSSTCIYARVSAIIAIRDKVPRVIIYSAKHLGKKYRLRLLSTDLTLIYTPLSTGITAYYNPNGRSNFFTVTCFKIFAAFSISSPTPLLRIFSPFSSS